MPPKENTEKLKMVILIGNGMTDTISDTASKFSEVEVLTGAIETLDLSGLAQKTDENTMFVVCGHGYNVAIPGETPSVVHFIDKARTDNFFNDLKKQLGHQNIYATLFACNSGSALKLGKIDEGISLLSRGSSKHFTRGGQNIDGVLKVLKWKITENLSNREIYVKLLREDLETFYYKGAAASDKVSKFPRIGKFYLDEIKDSLEEGDFSEDDQKKIITALIKKGRADFSIKTIIEQMELLGFNKIVTHAFKSELESQLRKEKLSPQAMKSFAENRGSEEFQTEDSKTEDFNLELTAPNILETLLIAISRSNIELALPIIIDNPQIVNMSNKHGTTPLMAASVVGSTMIAKLLLEKNANIEAQDENERTALSLATKGGHTEIIKILEEAQLLEEARKKSANYFGPGLKVIEEKEFSDDQYVSEDSNSESENSESENDDTLIIHTQAAPKKGLLGKLQKLFTPSNKDVVSSSYKPLQPKLKNKGDKE